MKLEPGTMVHGYKIVSLLGEGGMGEVYLGEDAMLERKVAIKRLNPLLTTDAQFSARFITEARIQARLNHPNIVALHSFFQEEGVYYMVMEHAAGCTLRDMILSMGLIPEARALGLFSQIAAALAYSHDMQIIHRDIKPSNIMVSDDDRIKIMDFGIARIRGEIGNTMTGQVVGSINYMSPEQIKAAKDIDHRTDIFSAGVLLYEMLTGKLPYNVDTGSDFLVMEQIVNAPLPDPRALYAFISDGTVNALQAMTAKDRSQRPGNMQTAVEILGGKAAHLPATQATRVSTNDATRVSPAVSNATVPAPQPVQVRKEASGMVYVAGGSFEMGNDTGRQDERPVHTVTLSAFYMAKFPVTQEQYQAVMKLNPSQFKGNKHPVEKISWRDAIRYCNMLSKIEGLKPCYLTGSSGMSPDNPECDWLANGYRLPTEAEWEYAARGGVYAQKGGPVATLDLRQEGGKTNDAMHMTQAVGLAPANELGITDMLGNVNEWCWDWYMVEYYAHSIARNPIGPMQGMYKVCRGGSWKNLSMSVTTRFSFELNQFYNNVGFRVVRSG